MWGESKPVEVAKPLEQRSVVVEPLPPEKHNNLTKPAIEVGARVQHKKLVVLGVGEVISRGLDGLFDVRFQGDRRELHEDDLVLA
jgi:hypothetical protein